MTYSKNLKVNKSKSKTTDILNQGQKQKVISSDLTNPDKILENLELINKRVESGLKKKDIEYLGDVIDMDTYKERIWNFENLPKLRLAQEKATLLQGPKHLKGCRKAGARARWKMRQRGRVSKAESELARHQELLNEFDQFKTAREQDIEQDKKNVTDVYLEKEREKSLEITKVPDNTPGYLEDMNNAIVQDSMYSISGYLDETISEIDKLIGYEIVESESEKKEREAKEKKNKKKKKEADKKGGAEAKDIEDELEAEAAVLENAGPVLTPIQESITDLSGNNQTDIKDVASLFKKILLDSRNPFKSYGKDGAVDLSESRYADIKGFAERVLELSKNLQITVPEELSYIIDSDNGFLMDRKDKFNPKAHANEAYVLLLSSVSKVYYETLNRFAGYLVYDGFNHYTANDDEERNIRNYDILNKNLMTSVRHMRDMTSAFANQIRKNRMEFADRTETKEEVEERNLKINVEILKDAQPVAIEEKEPEKLVKVKTPEEIYEEWKDLIENDIRGIEQVNDKDMKKKPWMIGEAEYSGEVLKMMKADPTLLQATEDEVKRYLIGINDNLYHNMLQLTDELPKTSVGVKFCYVPKMRDDFINKVKKERFAMLLRPDFHFRELLRNNNILDDLFDAPKYVAVKNRQNAIMDAINEELGIKFFTNARSLASLWANEEIQALLTGEITDKEQIKQAEAEALKDLEKEKSEEKEQKKGKNKEGGVLDYVVQKILSKSKTYGTTDENFKNTIEKIKANVRDNIAVIDRKISLMGLCDTAKDMLKRNVIKSMGGEYLLGYSVIAEDIVEYNVDNIMSFDGHAAEIQRTWDRKFARTGLPKRLSSKIERKVASKLNKKGENDGYYLRPEGYKTSKTSKAKWKEVNNSTNDIINCLKKLYNNDLKDLLKKIADDPATRSAIQNADKQYVGGKLKLTKEQWNKVEDYFENTWLEAFKGTYLKGKYSSSAVKDKLPDIKDKVIAALNNQLTINYGVRKKLQDEKNTSALKDYEDSLLSRDEYQDGLKSNAVILANYKESKQVVADDIEKQIFKNDALKGAFRSVEDRELFKEVLNEELKDTTSGLHAGFPYLDDVRSIEQISNLSLIDYTQFFMDLKNALSVLGSVKENAAKDKLLIDDWKLSGMGGDIYGIKRKLLKDFLKGGMTPEIFKENAKKYEEDANKQTEYDKMRLDAILATDYDPNNTYLKFNYLNIVGKKVNQIARIKKINFSEEFWKKVARTDETPNEDGEYTNHEERMTILIQSFLTTIKETKASKIADKMKAFGKFIENMKFESAIDWESNGVKWKLDKASEKQVSTYFGKDTKLYSADIETLKSIRDVFNDISKSDSAKDKLQLSDCIGEILLFGCGKQYFEAGGIGEKTFLDSDDSKYYSDIVGRSQEFINNRITLNEALKSFKFDAVEKNKYMSKLKPVIAGIVNTSEKKDMAENVRKFGVENIADLTLKLQGLFEKDGAEKRKESEKAGQLFIRRREYIDNYGDQKLKQNGKFRVVRDFLLKDPETWKIMMTANDAEFEEHIRRKDEELSPVLNQIMSDTFRGSMPINEQYVMANWNNFKNRKDWTPEQWYNDIMAYHDGFYEKKINGKSVRTILNNVQDRMVKAGIDKDLASGTLLMKATYILKADPASFALLYSEDDMFEAVRKVEEQYKANMNYLADLSSILSVKNQKKEKYVENESEDALYKEIAEIYNTGVGIEMQQELIDQRKVLRDLDQKKELSERDRIYADYNLLMQILRPQAYSLSTEQFKKAVLEQFKFFDESRNLARNANIYSDRTVLEAKEQIRIGIEVKKGEGRILQRKFDEDISDYSNKRSTLGTIGLVAYNADPKFDQKTIDKAAKFVDEHLNDNYGKADAEFIKGLLTERVIAYGSKIDEKKLSDYIAADKHRLVTLDTALRDKSLLLSEDDIKKAIVFAFAQNATRSKAPLDGSHEGDVKEILDELQERAEAISIKKPATKLALREYNEFIEEMDMARYTMSKTQFKEICDKRRKYFEFLDVCAAKIEEANADLAVQLALFDYFKKDIFETFNEGGSTEKLTETITDEIANLIGDKVKDNGEIKAEDMRKIYTSYLLDSGTLMQRNSSATLTAQERLASSTYTRDDVTKEIALSGRNDLIKEYNNLSLEEQKVFALVLTFPDIATTEAQKLSSNLAMLDREKELKKENELQEQLATFIYGLDFAPNIDYSLVMRRLMKTDKKTGLRRISKTVFDRAMKYTKFCIAKKIDEMPKDYDKLGNGRLTAEQGRILSGKNDEYKSIETALDGGVYYGPKSFKEFFTKYADSEVKLDKSVRKIAEKLGKYNDVQMYMLLHALQDRTAIDYTQAAGKWDGLMLRGTAFVNEERRDSIKNTFLRPDGMDNDFIASLNRSMNNEMYKNAAATLFSYQLDDTVDFTDKPITASNFAKDALKRTTKIDWKLLERAMNLVEEIENENLRIQICRQTTKHTTDDSSPNVEARTLGKEIDQKFREGFINEMDYFNDFIVREAKKNPEQAMPLVSAYSGLSDNEKMLFIHALKNRDILDISTDNTFTTAIGMNENKYVNERGRDRLADYYIDHLGVAGATNVLATSQYDTRSAMESLVSTQISDRRDPETKKTYADMMEGKKIFNWVYVGGRKTGVDWDLFGNALKFVRRTEDERKLLIGSAENYRATGNIDKYGRFMYNYQYMRKNLYRSGYRLTRFLGRRIRAEVEGAIPGYGVGQRIMMMCLGPDMRNKMLSTGIVKPGVSKNVTSEYLGYAGIGGTSVKATSSALAMVSQAAQFGTLVGGEALEQAASGLTGIYNIVKDAKSITALNKPMANEAELNLQSIERVEEAKKRQSKEQSIVTKEHKLNTDWILGEVSKAAVQSANAADILETATTCINVLSGSTFGIQAVTNYFVGGIRAAISETLHAARFITSVVTDKIVMDKYFADDGPLGAQIKKLRGENVDKIIADQTYRRDLGSRALLENSSLQKKETEFMDKMSNAELFRKAYGFKDFSEQANYVGWNIVQTLLQSASPFGADVGQFLRASLLLSALGCKDAIGKQDNETAQMVFNKLMAQDVR